MNSPSRRSRLLSSSSYFFTCLVHSACPSSRAESAEDFAYAVSHRSATVSCISDDNSATRHDKSRHTAPSRLVTRETSRYTLVVDSSDDGLFSSFRFCNERVATCIEPQSSRAHLFTHVLTLHLHARKEDEEKRVPLSAAGAMTRR